MQGMERNDAFIRNEVTALAELSAKPAGKAVGAIPVSTLNSKFYYMVLNDKSEHLCSDRSSGVTYYPGHKLKDGWKALTFNTYNNYKSIPSGYDLVELPNGKCLAAKEIKVITNQQLE